MHTEAMLHTAPLPAAACGAGVVCDLPGKCEAHERLYLTCSVENTGDAIYTSAQPHPIHLSYQWRALKGSATPPLEGPRIQLSQPLAPGECAEFSMHIDTPRAEGSYELVVTLVQEGRFWFHTVDPASACRREIAVRRPRAGDIFAEIGGIVRNRAQLSTDRLPTEEAGIVISACGRLIQPLAATLKNLRQLGCDLPVHVWHLPGEFTGRQLQVLGSYVPAVRFVETAGTPWDGLSGRHTVHGFKAWMLAHSHFRRTLMLDVNNFLLENPARIFESGHACILWQDGPWPGVRAKMDSLRAGLGLPPHGRHFESGQLYVDKESADIREALRLASVLNTLGGRLYLHTHGDKETYSLALDLLGLPHTIAPEPAVYAPSTRGDHKSLDGVEGFIQPWLDGTPLFFHALMHGQARWWQYRESWADLAREAEEMEALCR